MYCELDVSDKRCRKSDMEATVRSIPILLDDRKDGFFLTLWQAGLAEYDDMEGIAWRWQSIDGAMTKAPLALEAVGRNPTDREKKERKEICLWTLVGSRSR